MEEILKQSVNFRAILKDFNFGDLFVGEYIPTSMNHLFVSIQSFNSANFMKKYQKTFMILLLLMNFTMRLLSLYQKLLLRFKPKILLGLNSNTGKNGPRYNKFL